MREGHDGRQYTPVVATEYQRWPSAVLSRATTRAHRGSSATDVGFGLVVLAGDAVILLGPSYGAGETISPCPAAHTPVLAFKFDCVRRRCRKPGQLTTRRDALARPSMLADNKDE